MKSSKTDEHKFGESQVLVLSTQPPTHTLETLAVFLWKSREILLPRSERKRFGNLVFETWDLGFHLAGWDFLFYSDFNGGICNYPVSNI